MAMAKSKKPARAKAHYSAPALEKGFDIIELLARAPDGLAPSEIAQRLGRSLSEIFRILVVMERRGWLHKHPSTDKYSVSYRVLEYGFRATPAQALGVVAAPVMYELAAAAHQSCHMAVIADTAIIIVLQQESMTRSGFSVRLGRRCDVITSCSSHVLLAFSDAMAREKLLKTVKPLSGREMKEFLARLELVRKRGYEIKPSSRHVGVNDISYPVFGFDGHIRAALTMPFLTVIDGSQQVDIEGVRQLLAAAALKISQGLGWSESDPGKSYGAGSGKAKT
jgi:DNA-binding IclR family transcriptional regulator